MSARRSISSRLSCRVFRFAGIVIVLAVTPPTVFAQAPSTWSDTFESRVEILALMQTLNADILSSSSATKTLEAWCRDHKMSDDPRIVARLIINAVAKTPSAEQLQRLQVTSSNELKYRRVELRCGRYTLSEADNWFVPDRLTGEMNTLLETGDTPFGKAVEALRPYRRTIAATIIWSPLPAGWELRRRTRSPPRQVRRLTIPRDLFEHRAILYTSDNRPFSEVQEIYQGQILAFPRVP